MRTNRTFWGVVLMLLGGLFLLQTLGILTFRVWPLFWAIFLIILGIWFLFGSVFRPKAGEPQSLSIPLEGAAEASIEFNHGAGALNIQRMSNPGILLEGTFGGGVEHKSERSGGQSRIKLSALDGIQFPFAGSTEGYRWDVSLTDQLPLSLHIKTGASENQIDLSNLNITHLKLDTGASRTTINLPVHCSFTKVDVHAGAAEVILRVPEGVAARIHSKGGLASVKIDTQRFVNAGAVYESVGFDTAPNKVEISAEVGVGSIEIN